MEYSEATAGRVFVIRLTDGEILHESLERFAEEQGIKAAAVIALGGADEGSTFVVGPKEARSNPVVPMERTLDGVHEITGTGTIFPNEAGKPMLHMHVAGGRGEKTAAGCVRKGVRVWQVMEVVLWELTNTEAARRIDPTTGFELLKP